MRILNKIIITLLVAAVTSGVAAAQQAKVFNPTFPVLVDRPYNIVCEISIDASDAVGQVVDAVDISVDQIDESAVRNVRLMYSGTMSAIRSRTTCFVMKDQGKKAGGGQMIWCDPDFVSEVCNTSLNDGRAELSCGRKLVKGGNYMYISMEIDPCAVKDMAAPFNVNVDSVVVGGKPIDVKVEGSTLRHLGSSVRQTGDDGAVAYRIPGLVTTKEGSLIAVYDIRYDSSLDLQNNVDIGVSRSTDQGRTWEKMRVAMDMGEWGGLPQAQNGIGDPSVLVDETTGEIFIIAAWTHGLGADRAWTGVKQGMSPEETAQLMICSSKDDGKTWSAPVNITSQIKQPDWYFTLQGPGRGITMHDGTLVFPIQYIDTARVPNAGIIYSRDHGTTWKMHNHAYTNTTESQVAEVAPGVLMLNMRDNRKTGRRVCTTTDMGMTWTEHPSSGALIEPVCMGSLISVPAEKNALGRDILLFSNPATKKGRHHMTIKASLDGGYTWLDANSLLLDEEELWGYSCMSMIDEETVGIVYEASTAQLAFQAIKLSEIICDTDATLTLEACGWPEKCTAGYSKGISAPFCGSLAGKMVLAGGANFPEIPASEGGNKRFYKDIFTLSAAGKWHKAGELPQSLAYGASFAAGGKLIIAGGSNEDGSVRNVYALRLKGSKSSVTELTALPVALEQAGWASDGNELYIAGGLADGKPSRTIYKGIYDGRDVRWSAAGELPVAMVQPVACMIDGRLYVWGGFDPQQGDVKGCGYVFDPQTGYCSETAGVPQGGTFTGASAVAVDGKVVVIGGVDKKVFSFGLNASGADKNKYMNMPPAHYGFNKEIWVFDPVSSSWKSIGVSGKMALAGAGATAIEGCLHIAGGEIKPGVRTPQTWKIDIR